MRFRSLLSTHVVLAIIATTLPSPAKGQSKSRVLVVRSPATLRVTDPRDAAYSHADSDFVVGRTIYLRCAKTRIGVIEEASDSHTFPRRFPHSPAKAVLIRSTDGPRNWVPLQGMSRIYAVKKH